MASVGLLDDDNETSAAENPFDGLSREDVTASLKAWRDGLSLTRPLSNTADGETTRPRTSGALRTRYDCDTSKVYSPFSKRCTMWHVWPPNGLACHPRRFSFASTNQRILLTEPARCSAQ